MFTRFECGSSDLPVIPSIVNVYNQNMFLIFVNIIGDKIEVSL